MENLEIRFPGNNETAKNNTNVVASRANIKIIGVGGAGTNAITRMVTANISGVQLYAVNTDNDSLRKSAAENRISIGTGLGVGGDPVKGEMYAEESIDKFRDMLQGADMVFITTGMGGGTGTGAAPVIARVARELDAELQKMGKRGILIIGVVTKPFSAEGSERVENAKKGIAELREYTDALIVIPNDRIFSLIDEKTHYEQGFVFIDDVLRRAIESITDTITKTGTVNIDFADINNILKGAGNAIIGLGDGKTLEEAFNNAITNKFVEGDDIKEANRILINISYSKVSEIAVGDVRFAQEYIQKEFKHYISLKIGNTENNDLDTKIRVAIIASFKKEEEKQKANNDLFEDAEAQKKEEEKAAVKEDSIDVFGRPAYEIHKPRKL
ncbi:cell division protein FtsZ [Candidatus Ruminimicrobiellum ovillum]|uniref:cell division protein FtsZ n=1 Tax=Candidatus Ruminimicrobiellum ovillum TaxID=1947927 RepID=UPI00355AABCA